MPDDDLPQQPDLLRRLQAALRERYDVQGELGRGGMGTVFLARDLKHARPVALKVFRPELANAVGTQRFLLEIRTAARLHHPYVLTVHDSGEADGLLYYVMPYVRGESLRTRIDRDGRLPVADAIRIAREVADALDFAHGHGVVHRDIKPENVLLAEHSHVCVADFGLALALTRATPERLTATGLTLGSPLYISPEQAASEREIDGAADIYSLGCVLYEMLAGMPPFQGSTVRAVLVKQLTASPPSLRAARPEASAALESIVEKALAKEPAARGSAREFADSLAALAVEGGPDDARAPEAAELRTPGEAVMRPLRSTGAAGKPTIAVLPFTNLSTEAKDQFLSDGITEEIINVLARVPSLRVVARTSVFAFKARSEDVREIGRQLGAGVIVEGSVRRSGSRVRIVARLVNAVGGYPVWSRQYEQEIADIFAIEDDIARSVADSLAVTLFGEGGPAVEPRPPVSPAAYELYLRGRYCWNKRTSISLLQGIRFFEQAIGLDPDFPLALAGLADAWAVLSVYGTVAPSEGMPRARDAATRALSLDATLVEARATLGRVMAVHEWNWPGAADAFRTAIDARTSYPTTHLWYATDCLLPLGRFDEARNEIGYAKTVDPLSPIIHTSMGLPSYFARRYEEAIGEYERALQFDAGFGMGHYLLGRALVQVERFGSAIDCFRRAIELMGRNAEISAALAHALARRGDTAGAESLLSELRRDAERAYVSPCLPAIVNIGLGRSEEALDCLERAFDARAAELVWLRVHPVLDPLRGLRRFEALLGRLGLAT